MTLSTTESEVRYTGDSSTTSFGFVDGATPIPFFESTDLRVFVDDVLQTSGYSVSGSNVVFSTAPATDADIFIRRVIPLTQAKDYPTNDTFPSQSHEDALDKLTMIAQQQGKDIGKKIGFAESSETSGVTVPEPSAGKALVWNAGGTDLENSDADFDAVVTAAASSATAAAASASSASSSASSASSSATAAAASAATATSEADRAEAAANSVDFTLNDAILASQIYG